MTKWSTIVRQEHCQRWFGYKWLNKESSVPAVMIQTAGTSVTTIKIDEFFQTRKE
jgi:hypothetical protein